MNHQMLRRNAKIALKGNWGMLVLATLVYCVIMGAAGSTGFVKLIIYGPLSYGLIALIRRQIDRKQVQLEDLFSSFSTNFLQTLIAGIVVSVLIGVGTLLLIVPGIIACVGLSQTFMIMNDNPTIKGMDAVSQSWEMMKGHKMDYFVFILGFIGWFLLVIVTLGIAILYVQPYMTAAEIGYYRQLKGQGLTPPPVKG